MIKVISREKDCHYKLSFPFTLKIYIFSHELTSRFHEIISQVVIMTQQTSCLVHEKIECCCGITYMRIPDENTKKAYKQVLPIILWYLLYILKKFVCAWRVPFNRPQIFAIWNAAHFYSNVNERKIFLRYYGEYCGCLTSLMMHGMF